MARGLPRKVRRAHHPTEGGSKPAQELWKIRSLREGRAGRFLPIGTYGLMQVSSVRPLSDAESVETAIATRLAGFTVPVEVGKHGKYVTGRPFGDTSSHVTGIREWHHWSKRFTTR